MKLLKIPHDDPMIILQHYQASEAMLSLLQADLSCYALIQTAMQNALYSDAVTFLAHALPIRESIWWGASCASLCDEWSEDEWNAIRAAKAWVHTPDEISRRYAESMAKKIDLQTGAGWAAMSAFWSGGSMIAAKEPVVLPPPYLYAQAVAACINLSAILPDGAKAKARFESFIGLGLTIANGKSG